MCVYVCVRVCVWGYSSVTEHLPNMYEILGLITHTHTHRILMYHTTQRY
jgi:hypothetical protein